MVIGTGIVTLTGVEAKNAASPSPCLLVYAGYGYRHSRVGADIAAERATVAG